MIDDTLKIQIILDSTDKSQKSRKPNYSTVTLLAKFRGLSTSLPLITEV